MTRSPSKKKRKGRSLLSKRWEQFKTWDKKRVGAINKLETKKFFDSPSSTKLVALIGMGIAAAWSPFAFFIFAKPEKIPEDVEKEVPRQTDPEDLPCISGKIIIFGNQNTIFIEMNTTTVSSTPTTFSQEISEQ